MFKRSAVKLFILLVTLGSFHFVTQDVSAIDYEAELDFNNQIPQDRPFMDGSSGTVHSMSLSLCFHLFALN